MNLLWVFYLKEINNKLIFSMFEELRYLICLRTTIIFKISMKQTQLNVEQRNRLNFKSTWIIFVLALLMFEFSQGQNKSGKILDAVSKEPIAYASILVNKSVHLISNGEGDFSISDQINQANTTFDVSYLGYVSQTISIEQLRNKNYIITLQPSIYELNPVEVGKSKLDPLEIMQQVKANLNKNYSQELIASKERLFIRKGNDFTPKTLEVALTKSSDFSKSALSKMNSDIQHIVTNLKQFPPKEYTDLLGNYYCYPQPNQSKYFAASKLEVLQATLLKTDQNNLSATDLKKEAMNVLLKHLDSTKYYRVKSGLFGSRDTISLRKDFNDKKNKIKKNIVSQTKENIKKFLIENSLQHITSFDFVHHPERYNYKFGGVTYDENSQATYVLTFDPKTSKGKFHGKIYVSDTDFAILRLSYELAPNKQLNNINLKFLLGIKAGENIQKGVVVFDKKRNQSNYSLRYAKSEHGNYFYVNRPLKFIELTKKDKDVVALDLKIDGTTTSSTEFLVMSSETISTTAGQQIQEKNFSYVPLKAYDAKIWKNYNALEPIQSLKKFKSIDNQ